VDRNGRPVLIECPNVSPVQDGRGSAARHDTTVSIRLAGEIAKIPEYHDCQRLIIGGNPNAADHFGALVGIFASEALGAISRADFEETGGVAVAQLYNFSSMSYAVLGIRPRYSCLYLRLRSDSSWQANLVHMDLTDDCPPLDQWPGGGPLQVTRTAPLPRESDYPPVARWDWDPTHKRNYMAVKCVDAWCEIGVGPLDESPVYMGGQTDRVKGWYDEQALAVPGADGLIGPLINGRIVPEPRLDTLTEAHFTCMDASCTPDAAWVKVATAHLATTNSIHYQTKMNFTPGANQIFLRRKTRAGEEVWQTRIISAAGDTAFRRTLRVAHPGQPVPATARWHWREDDERTWVRCSLGCCEGGSDPISPDDWS
jgi:hypothetical protein